MKISLVQIHSGDDKEANFQKVKQYILGTAKHRPDIVCLAENFLYRGKDRINEPEGDTSVYIKNFREIAREQKINLILGSIILSAPAGKNTNTPLIINRNGEIIHRYDKMYMYDVERNDLTFRESDTVQPGNKAGFFELEKVKMGIGICVDLRYPEYFRKLVRLGAEVIFLPPNFAKVTGQLAWDVLTKSRAIENQVYFCACDQTGGVEVKERCGNSRIISFDGTIISEIGEEEGVVTADIDLEALRKFRKTFPVLRQMK